MTHYSEHLNLDFDPFDSDGQASHFYPRGKRKALLDQLIELSSYSSDLAVVTGPLGSGKSTLARWLALSLDDEIMSVAVQATLFMSPEQLLEAICIELDLETDGDMTTGELLEQLDRYAETLRARSRTLLLLVDDAHELGKEALASLFELLDRQADASLLDDDGAKAVLFGEAILLDSVEQLVPSAYRRFELEPLAPGETADYVKFKLDCAGFSGQLPMQADSMAVIHSLSRGIPGAINALVQDELSDQFSTRRTAPKLGFAERHLVAASVLFGVVVLVLFFSLGGEKTSSPADTTAIAGAGAGDERQRIDIPLALNGSTAASVSGPDTRAETPFAAAARTESTANGLSISAGTALEPPSIPVAGSAGVEAGVVIRPPLDTLPDPVVQDMPESATAGAEAQTGEQPGIVAPVVARPSATNPEQSLLSLSPESYTLQLLGSHSESNVKNFIAKHPEPGELNYFESRYQERPWYVVVYGNFPNRGEAQQAIGGLPEPLQALKPWARNLSDIQADIRRYQ